jgi:hypothetical protein
MTAKLLPTGEIDGILEIRPPNQKDPAKIVVSGKWIAARIDATHINLTLDMMLRMNERTQPLKTVTPLEIVDHETLRDAGGLLNKRTPG